MTGRGPLYDPDLLDELEERIRGPYEREVWRHVFEGSDPLAANVRGARWNPPGVEALYCAERQETAIAEIDHLVAMQPYPILTPRYSYPVHVHLSRMVDLSEVGLFEELGLDVDTMRADGRDECQRIGGAVAWLGIGGLVVPSLRTPGFNLVIYPNAAAPDDYWEAGDPVPFAAP
jgi:RES domain-containing protein